MIKLAADENLDARIANGLRRRVPSLDLMTVQGAGLAGASDPDVLAWAADEGRVLVSHDVSTIPPLAYQRVALGQPMPGVLLVPSRASLSRVLADLEYVLAVAGPGDIEHQVKFLPL